MLLCTHSYVKKHKCICTRRRQAENLALPFPLPTRSPSDFSQPSASLVLSFSSSPFLPSSRNEEMPPWSQCQSFPLQ